MNWSRLTRKEKWEQVNSLIDALLGILLFVIIVDAIMRWASS
jgi:hypothetical protein